MTEALAPAFALMCVLLLQRVESSNALLQRQMQAALGELHKKSQVTMDHCSREKEMLVKQLRWELASRT